MLRCTLNPLTAGPDYFLGFLIFFAQHIQYQFLNKSRIKRDMNRQENN